MIRRSRDPFERVEAGRLENILTTVAEMRSAIVRAMILLFEGKRPKHNASVEFFTRKGKEKNK